VSYKTSFSGRFELDKPLSAAHADYLSALSRTRRVKRDPDRTAARPDPLREAARLPVGPDGAFFVGAGGQLGQEGGGPALDPGGPPAETLGIVDFNAPPSGQPHVWCCWAPTRDRRAIHCPTDGNHYEYVSWLRYIIHTFLVPWGYSLAGEVEYAGEAPGDRGTIRVKRNAVEHLAPRISGPSGEGTAANERGEYLFHERRIDDALAAFELAVARAPGWASPLWMKGVVLGMLGRDDEGLACLGAAIELETDATARTERRRKLQAVFRSIGRADEGLARAAELRKSARFAEALEEYEGYAAAAGDRGPARLEALAGFLGAGLCLQGLNRFDDALASWDRAIALDPSEPSGWTYKAYLFAYQLGRPADALPCFAAAIERGNDSAIMWNEYGMAAGQSGDLSLAVDAFRQALARDEADALPWFNLAHTYLALDAPAQAVACFERAVALADPRCHAQAAEGLRDARRRLGG